MRQMQYTKGNTMSKDTPGGDIPSSEGSVSFDHLLTAGGLCSDGEDFPRGYPPLSGVYRESRGRCWDFDSVGRALTIAGGRK